MATREAENVGIETLRLVGRTDITEALPVEGLTANALAVVGFVRPVDLLWPKGS